MRETASTPDAAGCPRRLPRSVTADNSVPTTAALLRQCGPVLATLRAVGTDTACRVFTLTHVPRAHPGARHLQPSCLPVVDAPVVYDNCPTFLFFQSIATLEGSKPVTLCGVTEAGFF